MKQACATCQFSDGVMLELCRCAQTTVEQSYVPEIGTYYFVIKIIYKLLSTKSFATKLKSVDIHFLNTEQRFVKSFFKIQFSKVFNSTPLAIQALTDTSYEYNVRNTPH